jgi:beta-galactosidase
MRGDTIGIDRREALALTAGAATLSFGIAGQSAAALPVAALHGGRDQAFDDDWRFFHGSGSFEALGFDDSPWRRVDLPHDWSIEDLPGGQAPDQLGPFDKHSIGGTATGFSTGGEGWYRKHFRIGHAPDDARVELLFDGIYLDSDIWLNGRPVGSSVSGYHPFAVDLTPALHRDGDNVLAVRVRNLGQNSRWYSGSGLYRQVKLDVLPAATRLARWGVAAWTRSLDGGAATVEVTTSVEAADPALTLVTRLRDSRGAIAAEARSPVAGMVKQVLVVRGPRLWSPDNPSLYSLETELMRGTGTIDRMVQDFGIRIVIMEPRLGMAINGTPTKLRGGCIHHDNGLLGACAYRDADERKLLLLKARGYNAIRSSHNIPSRSLREACDRVGMLLIAEAFDAWHSPKLPQDFSTRFADHWHEVIEALVLSARNSPSVIMWSIGNEIPYRATDEGVRWEWQLANAVRRLDPTRPVTAALNGVLGAPMIAADGTARPGMAGKTDNASTIFLDVPGYNYRLEDIESEQSSHPERVVYASETFPHDVHDYWTLGERAPYFLGEFVWTAMDYLGEAGIGATARVKGNVPYYVAGWPWVVSWCGDIDLIGQQKAPSLARDVVWGISPLEVTVQHPVPDGQHEFIANWGWSDETQSWSWAGSEGKPLAVRIYSSAERVELRLNGVKLGGHEFTAADKMKAEFKIAYAPGILEAVAYRGASIVARRRLETVSAPARMRLTVETAHAGGAHASSDRQALHYVAVEIVDGAGRAVPDAMQHITLSVSGPAELVGFGSANPQAVGSFQSPQAQSFRGRALAILRSQGKPGTVRIGVSSDGLISAATILRIT